METSPKVDSSALTTASSVRGNSPYAGDSLPSALPCHLSFPRETVEMWQLEAVPNRLPSCPSRCGKKVNIVGASVSLGQCLDGVARGPAEIRRAGLAPTLEAEGWKVEDFGNVGNATITACESTVKTAEATADMYGEKDILNCLEVGRTLGELHARCTEAGKDGGLVLTLGGDHGIATASISANLKRHPDLCVLWLDAHADCNTPETSPSRHYHGMPLAHLFGWFKKTAPNFGWLGSMEGALQPASVAYIGLRDVDAGEREILFKSGVAAYSMQHVDKWGIGKCMASALANLDPTLTRPIHVSLDIDGCDPSIAPGTGTLARGGLSYREIRYILEAVAATGRLVSMDVVEVNPALEPEAAPEGRRTHGDLPTINPAAGPTSRLAVECIRTALGGSIL